MIYFITFFLTVLLSISFYNFLTAPRFRKLKYTDNPAPFISVLIPARNEAKNIGSILSALSKQDYPYYEVIAGNDNSDDETEGIIDGFSARYNFIKKVNISELPLGWKGKNHALHTMYKYASGELILFADSDVKLDESTLATAAAYMKRYKADVISVFPTQEMETTGERLIVPLLNFFLLTLLPLKQVYKSDRKSFSAGIGQFILFKRNAYDKCGGHEGVKEIIAEDVELIRKAKVMNLKVLTLLDDGLISCRMYNGFSEAVEGFTKNFFKGSGLNIVLFLFFLSLYCFIFLGPVFIVFINAIYIIPLLIIVLTRLFISAVSKQHIAGIFLHPFQIFMLWIIGLRSAFNKNSVLWKGRTV